MEKEHAWLKAAHDTAQFISEQYAKKFDDIRAQLQVTTKSWLTGTGIYGELTISIYAEPLRYQKVYRVGEPIDTAELIMELEDFYTRCSGRTR